MADAANVALESRPSLSRSSSSGNDSKPLNNSLPGSHALARKLEKTLKGQDNLLRGTPGHDDVVTALSGLDGLIIENTKHTRQNLRSQVERRALETNKEFLNAFSKVYEALEQVDQELESMCQACATMTSQLDAAKQETAALVEKTSALSSSREQLSLKRHLLQAFTERYQLAPEEHAVLVGDKPMDFTFFSALRRVQTIHQDCKRLLRTSHQKAGVDIMDQMATLQEKAYERLYRWTQGTCRSMTTESVDQTRRLNMAFNALRARPVLFQYSINELATARRNARVRGFIDALTHGGPGGNPPPIELHSHDPLRYVSDMLAYVHQSLAAEKELIKSLLSSKQYEETLNGDAGPPATMATASPDDTRVIAEALDSIVEGVCRPLKMRIETVLTSLDRQVLICYKLACLLAFYRNTATSLIGLERKSSLADVLSELHATALKIFYDLLRVQANQLLVNVDVAPSDLSPPKGLMATMTTIKSVLEAQATSHGTDSSSDAQELDKILSTVLDPALQMCALSASNLGTADMATFMLNCFYKIQTVLTLYDSTDRRLETLESQMETHVATLCREQVTHLATRAGLQPVFAAYQQWEAQSKTVPLAQFPGLSLMDLRQALIALDRFIADADFSLLSQATLLQSSRVRANIQNRAFEAFLAAFTELYEACNAANAGYATQPVIARTPEQVRQLMS
eukprot:TRINITY_DN11055_c0_g2_i4.p1 TRINITY_DN11055_c0_g2~~TRINITY_DN11055_c0_g2_i4.p1  ORF type:complete len:687 (+),score=161.29 TRINITY_DN11055_c0_g2_i4:3-2063(+)